MNEVYFSSFAITPWLRKIYILLLFSLDMTKQSILKNLVLAVTLSSLLSPTLKSQTKPLQVVDPLLYSQYQGTSDSNKAGLQGINVFYTKDNITDTLVTDSLGYVFLPIDTTKNINVNEKWNLISVPVNAEDMSKESLFPTALSSAYRYENKKGYVQDDTLDPGIGYWMKFSTQEVIPITGTTIDRDTLEVLQGWNLLSVYSKDVPVADIQDNGIRASHFYAYNGNYEQAETLYSGKGYWVKTFSDGTFILMNTRALENIVDDNVPLDAIFNNKKERKVQAGGTGTLGYGLKIKDELSPSIGNYYDYDSTFSSIENVPDKIPLFPSDSLLNDSNPNFSSLLEFDKWFTYSDDTYNHDVLLIDYPENWPLKVFANRLEMPDSNYSLAFDSSKKEWENATSFMYKVPGKDSVLLDKEILEQEVSVAPDTGIKYQYQGNLSYQVTEWNYPQPFPPNNPVIGPAGLTRININPTIGDLNDIKRVNNRERKHRYFYPNDNGRDNPDSTDNDYSVKTYIGKLLKLNKSLQKFFTKELPRMSVWKED